MVITAVSGVIQRLLQIASTLVVIPLALQGLGVELFGVWGGATSLTGLTAFLDAGLSSALISRIPQALAAGENERTRDEVASALAVAAVIAALVAGSALVFFFLGETNVRRQVVVVAALCLGLNVPLSVSGSIWFGLNKGYAANIWETVQTALQLLAVVVLHHRGLPALIAAIYAPILACNAGSLLHVLVSHAALRPRVVSVTRQAVRAVVRPGAALFAIYVANSATFVFDTLLTLAWIGSAAAAQMTVMMRVCTTIAALLAVITQPLWPAFADAHHRQNRAWIARYLGLGSLGIFVAACASALAIALCGQWAIALWLGTGLQVPPALLWAAAGWIVVICPPRVAGLYMNAAGILLPQLYATLATLALAFTLKWFWAGSLGVVGILLASPVSWLLVVWPVYATYAARALRAPGAQRP